VERKRQKHPIKLQHHVRQRICEWGWPAYKHGDSFADVGVKRQVRINNNTHIFDVVDDREDAADEVTFTLQLALPTYTTLHLVYDILNCDFWTIYKRRSTCLAKRSRQRWFAALCITWDRLQVLSVNKWTMSLTNITNSNGSRTLPCTTPLIKLVMRATNSCLLRSAMHAWTGHCAHGTGAYAPIEK